MTERAFRAVAMHGMLREAIASVALSHSDDCACTVCRAAAGDEDAFMAILLEQADG